MININIQILSHFFLELTSTSFLGNVSKYLFNNLGTLTIILVAINPVNATSIPKKAAIMKGAKDDAATISMRIRCHIMPSPPLTGMAYAARKAIGSPIIDPAILSFLSLKIAYKITSEILIGINKKNIGIIKANANPSSN
jgi:hypothetical protein